MTGLREQKRERTRRALLAAARQLFAEKGYAATTMAEIAAAADVSPRTAFTYFPAKDDLLFPDAAERIHIAVAAFEECDPSEDPMQVLVRALGGADIAGTDLADEGARLRLLAIRDDPAVRGRALRLLAEAQTEIGRALHEAFPERFSPVQAAALTGAFIGATTAAVDASWAALPDATPLERHTAVAEAVAQAVVAGNITRR